MARADEDSRPYYEYDYLRTSEELGVRPDWNEFDARWAARHESQETMAQLLSLTMGLNYDDALAWVEDRDTP